MPTWIRISKNPSRAKADLYVVCGVWKVWTAKEKDVCLCVFLCVCRSDMSQTGTHSDQNPVSPWRAIMISRFALVGFHRSALVSSESSLLTGTSTLRRPCRVSDSVKTSVFRKAGGAPTISLDYISVPTWRCYSRRCPSLIICRDAPLICCGTWF